MNFRQRFSWLRWRYSPYWRGYRDGLLRRDEAHQRYLRLKEHFE